MTTPFADFGSDVSDAVFAYRSLWNDYVVGTAQAMDQTSADLVVIAQNPPDGWTVEELNRLSQTYAEERDAIMASWNQFAGKTENDVTAEGDVMVSAFQKAVASAEKFWANDRIRPLVPISEPAKPSKSQQSAVATQIKKSIGGRSGIALVFQSLTGIEAPTMPTVGDAALGFVKDHWFAIGVTVLGVGLGVKALSLAGRAYVKVATGGLI